jgi:uncharacterized protein (TIGR03083 family)
MAARTPSSAAVASIRSLSGLLAELVTTADRPDAPVGPTPGWSVTQVVAHLAGVTVQLAPEVDTPDARQFEIPTARRLGTPDAAGQLPVPRRAPGLPAALDALRCAVAALPSGPGVDAAGPVPYAGAVEVVPADLFGLILGEFLVHGHDLAATLRRPWPIDPEQAAEVLRAVVTVLPAWVDPARATDVCCVIELKVRGDRRYRWQLADGALVADPPGPRPADVTISARPAAMVMLLYGRLSPWRGIVTGRVRGWGRRPGLVLEAARFLRAPDVLPATP